MSKLFGWPFASEWKAEPLVSKKPKTQLSNKLFLYPTVHKEDQLPVNIIKPDLKSGPWIAGGACLRWFQNKPVGQHSDIDVFCKNEKQANDLIEYINNEIGLTNFIGYTICVFKSDNAHTFNVHSDGRDWKIQVITCKYFNNIQDVIDSFDITVSQIATTGNEWILGEQTAKDINERNLRFRRINKHTPKRLIKYWTYGFNPVPGTIEAIQQHPICSWNFLGSEEYDNTL